MKVKILAHRGLWRRKSEANTPRAICDALENGWGVEFDVRDHGRKLVISHEPPGADSPLLETIRHELLGTLEPLAVNVKADGLEAQLIRFFEKSKGDYFFFDMSVPSMVIFTELGAVEHVCTRKSEFEKSPIFYDDVHRIWLDEMRSEWITENEVKRHLSNGKKVYLVSPELHARRFETRWIEYRNWLRQGLSLAICTDFPKKCQQFFEEFISD